MIDNPFASYGLPAQTASERRAEIYFDTLDSILLDSLTPKSFGAAGRFSGLVQHATDPGNKEDEFIVIPKLAQTFLERAARRAQEGRIGAARSSVDTAREVTRNQFAQDRFDYVRRYAFRALTPR